MKLKWTLLTLLVHQPFLFPTSGTWISLTTSPNNYWTTPGNWSGGVPNGIGDSATFNITGPTDQNFIDLLAGSAFTLGSINVSSNLGIAFESIPMAPNAKLTMTALSGSTASITFQPTTATTSATSGTIEPNIDIHLGSKQINFNIIDTTSPSNLTLNFAGLITEDIPGAALIKTGTGILALTGPLNSYTGGTTISGGTILVNLDQNLGPLTSTNVLTLNGGTLAIQASNTLNRAITLTGNGTIRAQMSNPTIGGLISGAGGLTITSDSGSSITLTNLNTYKGSTTINSATLIIGYDGPLGDASGTILINNGTLQTSGPMTSARSGTLTGTATFDGNSELVLTGNWAGSGALTIKGNVQLLPTTGVNSYSQGTTLTLSATLLGNTNGIQGPITMDASSQLTFNQTFNGTYSGALSSVASATFTKLGSGTVELPGNSSAFVGLANVNAGTLNVNGTLLSSLLTVNSGATLSGAGHLGAITVNANGRLDPGNGINVGTLSVAGTLTLNSGSQVNLNIAPLHADQIAVAAPASIASALVIEPVPGFYGFSATYPILTSTVRTGQFGPITTTNSAFIPTQILTGTDVILQIDITNPFALFSFSNSNTEAVGNNLTALHTASQLPPDVLKSLNSLVGASEAEVNSALDQMHPAPLSALTEMQAETAAELLSLFSKMPQTACLCDSSTHLWIAPFGNSLTLKKTGMQIGSESYATGFAIGLDGKLLNELSLGFGGAYQMSQLHWHNSRGHSSINAFYGSIYSNYQSGNFCVSGALLIGKDFYETSRHIHFVKTNKRCEAHFSQLDCMGKLSSRYLFGSPYVSFFPYLNFDLFSLHTPTFHEQNGGGFNLKVHKRDDMTLRSEMGLGLQIQDTNRDETLCFGPSVSIGYVNMCPLKRDHYTSTFQGATIPFRVRGWDTTWNLLQIDLGLNLSSTCFSLGVEYILEISPDSETTLFNQNGNLTFSWKW